MNATATANPTRRTHFDDHKDTGVGMVCDGNGSKHHQVCEPAACRRPPCAKIIEFLTGSASKKKQDQ